MNRDDSGSAAEGYLWMRFEFTIKHKEDKRDDDDSY